MGIPHVHSADKPHITDTGHNYRSNLDKPCSTGHNYRSSSDKPRITGTGRTEAVQTNHAAQAQADI